MEEGQSLNQSLAAWFDVRHYQQLTDASKPLTTSPSFALIDASYMFAHTVRFNQSLKTWSAVFKQKSAIQVTHMFHMATAFRAEFQRDADITSWYDFEKDDRKKRFLGLF